VNDAKGAVSKVLEHFAALRSSIEQVDGVSADFESWRFNLRSSNTEPLLRLNVESRGSAELMNDKTRELTALIGG
jgi:phosphomannomutase/phosphoglucomutase